MYKDPSLNNKYFVSFGIYGFECSPDELTEKLGINPTETRIKGEYKIVGKEKFQRKRLNKENVWILNSELPYNRPLDEHIKNLLLKIEPHKDKFKDATSKYYSEFSCAPYYYEANPGMQFDNRLLKRIADLETLLDIDIYCLAGTISQFEQTKAKEKLTKQLSQFKSVSGFNDDNHNEPQALANSLIEIDAARSSLEMHMEDLVVWDDLEDELYKEKLSKVSEDLKKIINAIKRSKSLKNILEVK